MASQALPIDSDTPTKEEGSPTRPVNLPVVLGDSDEEDGHDPMVSAPIRPFVIQVGLRNPHTDAVVYQGALIDLGVPDA